MTNYAQHPTKKDIVNWLVTVLNRPPLPCDPELANSSGVPAKSPVMLVEGRSGKQVKAFQWKEVQDWANWTEAKKEKFVSDLHGHGELTNKVKGLSTLGGSNGKHFLAWIDFDRKNFVDATLSISEQESQASNLLESTINNWFDRYPVLKDAPLFKTPSGGVRVLIALNKEPINFGIGFTLEDPTIPLMGELLQKNGAHTLLPPTQGVNGNYYLFSPNEDGTYSLEYPPIVDSPVDVGIIPVKNNVGNSSSKGFGSTTPISRSNLVQKTEPQLVAEAHEIITKLTNAAASNPDVATLAANYETWLSVGMSLHSVSNSEQLLDDWIAFSKTSSEFEDGVCELKWDTFGANQSGGLTIGTLIKYAQDCGVIGRAQHYGVSGNNALQPEYGGYGSNLLRHPTADRGRLTAIELSKEINRISNDENISEAMKQLEFAELARSQNITVQQINSVRNEFDSKEMLDVELAESNNSFKKLVNATTKRISLSEVLSSNMAHILTDVAKSLGVEQSRMLQVLLPMVGTCVGGRMSVKIRELWEEYPVIWTADIAPPSSGKTAMRNVIMGGLVKAQQESSHKVRAAIKEFEEIERNWNSLEKNERQAAKGTDADPKTFDRERLKERKRILTGGTIQATQRIIADQPDWSGVNYDQDELPALFGGWKADANTSGGGGAKEWWLKAWNGPIYESIDRADSSKTIRFFGQCVNLSGAIQPELAATHFASNLDPDGFLSRLLPIYTKLADTKGFDDWHETPHNCSAYTRHIQERIQNLVAANLPDQDPEDILKQNKRVISFSTAAKEEYVTYWRQLRGAQKGYESDKAGYANFIGKQGGYVARLALCLHLLDWADSPNSIDEFVPTIDIETMKRAIALSRFYCKQYLLLSAGGGTKKLEEQLLEVFNWVRTHGGTANARNIYRVAKFAKTKVRGRYINAEIALSLLNQIAKAGYGEMVKMPGCSSQTLVLHKEYLIDQNISASLSDGDKTDTVGKDNKPSEGASDIASGHECLQSQSKPPSGKESISIVDISEFIDIDVVAEVVDNPDDVLPISDQGGVEAFSADATGNASVESTTDAKTSCQQSVIVRTLDTMAADINLVAQELTDAQSARLEELKTEGARIIGLVGTNASVVQILTIDLSTQQTEIQGNGFGYTVNTIRPVLYISDDIKADYLAGADLLK